MDKKAKNTATKPGANETSEEGGGGGFGGGGASGTWIVQGPLAGSLSDDQRDVLQGKVVRSALQNPKLRALIDRAAEKHATAIRAARKK